MPKVSMSVRRSVSRHATRAAVQTVAAVLLAVTLASCTDKPKARDTDVGGTLIISVPLDAQTLYAPAASGVLDQAIINCIFDRLADMPANLNTVGDSGFVPQLATGWKWAPDSLSIAFSINPKARWHDGQPVRAEDVQFSFKVFSDTASGAVGAELVSNIDSVSVADSLTAVVWYKRRTLRQFFEATYNLYVLPSHILGKVPPHELAEHPFSRSPVGSGRFRFAKWERKQRIEVIADTANYRGRAKLDRVIWNISGGVAQSTVSTFAGEADFFEKLSPDNLPQAVRSPNVRVVPYSQVGYSFLTFNLHARKNGSAPHPVFGDVRVRQALTMAVDRERLARVVLDSFAAVSIGPSPRSLFPDPASVKPLPFDVAHAKALLDSAGWVLAPGQTVRARNGVPLAFELLVTVTSAPRTKYASLLEQEWGAIGAKVNVRAVESNAVGAQMGPRDFDTWMGAYTVTPGLQALPSAWGTRGIVNGRNYGGYSNPRFDALVDSALNTLKPERARAYWVRAFNEMMPDAPAVWLFEERSIGLLHRRVRPTLLRADAWYAGLADWTIDPAQRIARDRTGLGDGR